MDDKYNKLPNRKAAPPTHDADLISEIIEYIQSNDYTIDQYTVDTIYEKYLKTSSFLQRHTKKTIMSFIRKELSRYGKLDIIDITVLPDTNKKYFFISRFLEHSAMRIQDFDARKRARCLIKMECLDYIIL